MIEGVLQGAFIEQPPFLRAARRGANQRTQPQVANAPLQAPAAPALAWRNGIR